MLSGNVARCNRCWMQGCSLVLTVLQHVVDWQRTKKEMITPCLYDAHALLNAQSEPRAASDCNTISVRVEVYYETVDPNIGFILLGDAQSQRLQSFSVVPCIHRQKRIAAKVRLKINRAIASSNVTVRSQKRFYCIGTHADKKIHLKLLQQHLISTCFPILNYQST